MGEGGGDIGSSQVVKISEAFLFSIFSVSCILNMLRILNTANRLPDERATYNVS